MVNDELYTDMRSSASYRLGQTLASAMGGDKSIEGRNWKDICEHLHARTCVVAGVLDDGEQDCLERGEQLKRGSPESKAFKVENRRHAWDLQDPELFARGIKAWMEGEELPEEYIRLA